MLDRLGLSDWKSPFREAAYCLLLSITGVAVISAAMWFGGIIGAILAVPIGIILAGSWIAVVVIGVRAAWLQRTERGFAIRAAATPALGFMLACALALPVVWSVAWALNWASFLGNYRAYKETTQLAETGAFDKQAGIWQEHDGVDFIIDTGPPRRLAFPKPGGFLDNWSGVIYDPTGVVMRADGFDPITGEFAAPDRITKLFDGDLVSCSHLIDDFYDCSFT
jgi:hypothetical protein